MKQKLLYLLFFIVAIDMAAQTIYIPDDNFEQALIDLGYDDVLDDYVLTNNINLIKVLDIQSKNIVDLTGISGFIALENLDLDYNNVIKLDLTSNINLKVLSIKRNKIDDLNIESCIDLIELYADNNELTSLNISKNIKLEIIEIFDGSLYTGGNKLTELDISKNLELVRIDCSANSLEALDFSQHKKISYLNCSFNPIKILNVQNGNNKNFTGFGFQWISAACIKVDDAEWSKQNWIPQGNTRSGFSEFCSDTGSQKINDANLEQALIDIGIDVIGELDGFVAIEDIINVTDLDLSNRNIEHIGGLTGFTSLKNLNLSNNLMDYDCQVNMSLYFNWDIIEQLDVSNNLLSGCFEVKGWTNLKELNCSNNQLGTILLDDDANLEKLICNNNNLRDIDSDANNFYKANIFVVKTLNYLDCSNNNFEEFRPKFTSENFYFLNVENSQIQTIDIKNGNNKNITNFNINNNPKLICISVDDIEWSENNWTKDTTTQFNINCNLDGISDREFEQILIDKGLDKILDKLILIDNVKDVKELEVSGTQYTSNLDSQLRQFVSLERIDCFDNTGLTRFDLGDLKKIEEVNCFNNQQLKFFIGPNSGSNFTKLQIYDNQLFDLNIRGYNKMNTLICNGNYLSNIDLSKNYYLKSINVSDNRLTSINFSNNTFLKKIDISENNITSLDISNKTDLETLDCSFNPIKNLDVSNNLKLHTLNANKTELTSINFTQNNFLRELSIAGNFLSELNLSNNSLLEFLDCSSNQLTDLDLTKNYNLTSINCNTNLLINLNVKNGNNKNIKYDTNINGYSFKTHNNLDLNCIQVDDAVYSKDNFSSIDVNSRFSQNCSLPERTYVPDDNFEKALIRMGIDDIEDDYVNTVNIECLINLSVFSENISDLTGIENFLSLINLDVDDNNLTQLDVSKLLKLKTLICNDNQLTTLKLTPSITGLYIYNNKFLDLDVSELKFLKTLSCRNNLLKIIDVSSNLKLEELECGINPIESLDVSNNLELDLLACYESNIKKLDISNNRKITKLAAFNNPNMTDLAVNNTNNKNFSLFIANSNPKLTCIQVDDIVYAVTNFTSIDSSASFSLDCNPLINNEFITKWKTTTGIETITIPVGIGIHNFNVDWGDGSTIENISSGDASHVYKNSGIYLVKITGSLESIDLSKSSLTNRDKLLDVLQWGKINWKTFNNSFSDCKNLKISAIDNPNLRSVTDLSFMFNNSSLINTDISKWDVSNINDMNHMFASATSLNQSFARWNISNVINMQSIFDNSGMSVINYDKTLTGWSNLSTSKQNVNLGASGVNFCNSETARTKLKTDFNWSINDAGKDCSTIDTPTTTNGMWNDPANWANGVVPTTTDNVVIPTGTTLQISADISEINSLENEGTIVISPTFSLKSKSNMVNSGTIVMNSGTDDSSVLFIEGTSTGNVVYKRGGLKANKWSLVTPPVSGQKIKAFALETNNDIRVNTSVNPNRYAIGYYDDALADGSKWGYYTENVDTDLTFTAGDSYAISRNTDGSVSFTGTLSTGNVTRTLQAGQWNAIGNPFTTYYPANKNSSTSFLNENYDKLDDDFKGLYVWDATQNKYIIVSELDLQNRSFTPGQGFFIKLKVGANEVLFNESKRSIKPTTGNNIFNKSENRYIKLFANNGTYNVETDIKFLNTATLGFDVGLDIGNFGSNSFDLYSHLSDNSNTKNYTIQSLPFDNTEDIIIPLGVHASNSEIEFSSLHKNLHDNVTLVLEDKIQEVFTDITNENNNYKIAIETSESTANRFFLHVNYSNSLNLNNPLDNVIHIYASDNTLHVKGLNNSSSIEMYNILGQSVFKTSIDAEKSIMIPSSIKKGVYTVKLSSGNRMITKKIVIN
jgi:surface protein